MARTKASARRKADPSDISLCRVATETRRFSADDLSGSGAAVDPGRWNRLGDAVLYAATSVALATLETAAHVAPAGLPLNKFLVRISVPNKVWRRRQALDVSKLGPAWNAIPAGLVSEALACSCGSRLLFTALILESDVARRILDSLGLESAPPPIARARSLDFVDDSPPPDW
jgi:hypothetical protein